MNGLVLKLKINVVYREQSKLLHYFKKKRIYSCFFSDFSLIINKAFLASPRRTNLLVINSKINISFIRLTLGYAASLREQLS